MPAVLPQHSSPDIHQTLEASNGLRSKGIRSVVFIDNILLMGPSEEVVLSHTALTLDLLELLEYLINYPKSHLTPARKIDFLGFQVDSSTIALSLPESKITHI